VIRHGQYHSTALYVPFIRALQAQGFEAYCPQLPTCDLTKLNVGDIDHTDIDCEPPFAGYLTDIEGAETRRENKSSWLGIHLAAGLQPRPLSRSYRPSLVRLKESPVESLDFSLWAFIIPIGESVHSYFRPKEGPVIYPTFTRFPVSVRHPLV
jgi:hypothetical protein